MLSSSRLYKKTGSKEVRMLCYVSMEQNVTIWQAAFTRISFIECYGLDVNKQNVLHSATVKDVFRMLTKMVNRHGLDTFCMVVII